MRRFTVDSAAVRSRSTIGRCPTAGEGFGQTNSRFRLTLQRAGLSCVVGLARRGRVEIIDESYNGRL
jgi:hypothetical protein